MRRFLFSLLVCLVAAIAYADDRTLTGGEYWIDNAVNDRVQVSIANGWINFTLEAGYLNEGLHALHYRAKDSEGFYSPTQTWLFFRYVADVVGGSVLEYWFDEGNHQTVEVSGAEGNFVLDASALDEGLHALHYRLNTLSDQTGAENTWLFYRVVPAYAGGSRTLEYWIDEGEHHSRSVDGDNVSFVLDASTTDEGLHTFHYQLMEEGGRVSPQQSWLFYRIVSQPKAKTLKWYRVWWNDHEDDAITMQLNDATFVYEQQALAVPDYARNDGYSRDNTARFNIVFCDDQGQLSPVVSAVVSYPDVYPPVTTLTATKSGDSVKLSWQANADDIRDYNLYYSEGGQPYVLWKPNVTTTEATFRGQKGSTYRFIITARDVNGNYEAMEESKSKKVTF